MEENKENNVNNETVMNENPVKDKKKYFSIAALILGILAIILSCTIFIPIIFGIIAIVLGALGLKSSKRGMSIAGIVTGSIGIVLAIIMTFILISLGILIFNKASDVTNQVNDYLDSYSSEYFETDYDSLYDHDFNF